MKMIKVIIIFLFSVQLIFAQDISTTEIKVSESFEPKIPDANRLNQNAVFADTIKKNKKQKYDIIDVNLKSNYKITPLKSAIVKPDRLSKLYPFSIGVGTGYRIISKFHFSYGSKRSKDVSYAILFNNLNKKVNVQDKTADQSNSLMNLNFKKINSDYIFLSDLRYERKNSFSYGHQQEIANFGLKNRFNYTRLTCSIFSQEEKLSNLGYNAVFFVSDLNERSENRFSLDANVNKRIKAINYNINMTFDNYSNYNSNQQILMLEKKNVQLYSLKPSLNFSKFNINFDLVLGFDYATDGKFDVFPALIFEKEMVDNILLVSAGIQDDKQRNTYKTLSDENPFIHALGTNQIIVANDVSQDLRTTELKEVFVNFKNKLSQSSLWEANLSYGYVENFSYFDNYSPPTEANRFIINYVDVWQLAISSSYNQRINDIGNLIVDAKYYSWNLESISHRPNLLINTYFSVNLRDKILINPSVSFFGSQDSYAMLYEMKEVHNMPERVYLNIDFKYNYSKKMSLNLGLKNILNTKSEIWRGYNEIGFNGFIEATYLF